MNTAGTLKGSAAMERHDPATIRRQIIESLEENNTNG
jgi:hypothetical protein